VDNMSHTNLLTYPMENTKHNVVYFLLFNTQLQLEVVVKMSDVIDYHEGSGLELTWTDILQEFGKSCLPPPLHTP
jgi:hypothetical protein